MGTEAFEKTGLVSTRYLPQQVSREPQSRADSWPKLVHTCIPLSRLSTITTTTTTTTATWIYRVHQPRPMHSSHEPDSPPRGPPANTRLHGFMQTRKDHRMAHVAHVWTSVPCQGPRTPPVKCGWNKLFWKDLAVVVFWR